MPLDANAPKLCPAAPKNSWTVFSSVIRRKARERILSPLSPAPTLRSELRICCGAAAEKSIAGIAGASLTATCNPGACCGAMRKDISDSRARAGAIVCALQFAQRMCAQFGEFVPHLFRKCAEIRDDHFRFSAKASA